MLLISCGINCFFMEWLFMKKIDLEKLRYLVCQKRKERGITQDNLSKVTNINMQIISRIELGKTIPSIQQLNILLEALNINIDDIIISNNENDVFDVMRAEAKTVEERLEHMIAMMLCLRKHDRLRKQLSERTNPTITDEKLQKLI